MCVADDEVRLEKAYTLEQRELLTLYRVDTETLAGRNDHGRGGEGRLGPFVPV